MPRLSSLFKLLPLCLLVPAALASAQQNQPSQEPPKLERIEPGSDEPATTIPDRSRTKITEKKQGGQVTEVEVQSGKSRYIMRPNVPAGNAQPGDAQSSAIRAPQWQVLEFDLTGKRGAGVPAGQGAPAAADVPPPPPMPAQPAKPAKK
jgi:hypothetical protein